MNQNNRDREADIIKVAALLTATPRWAGALLAADGVPKPPQWDAWWQPIALLLSVGMAAVEGFALAYIMHRWNQKREQGENALLWLALIALIDFAIILTPYVASNVSGAPLDTMLGTGVLLWAWSIAVAASTGIVVVGVGYAQRTQSETIEVVTGAIEREDSQVEPAIQPLSCSVCGATEGKSGKPFLTQAALTAHRPWCPGPPQNGKGPIESVEEKAHD